MWGRAERTVLTGRMEVLIFDRCESLTYGEDLFGVHGRSFHPELTMVMQEYW